MISLLLSGFYLGNNYMDNSIGLLKQGVIGIDAQTLQGSKISCLSVGI